MKQFSCGAVVPGCQRQFRAVSEVDILAEVAVHAREDHGLATVSPAMVDLVRGNIRTVAA